MAVSPAPDASTSNRDGALPWPQLQPGESRDAHVELLLETVRRRQHLHRPARRQRERCKASEGLWIHGTVTLGFGDVLPLCTPMPRHNVRFHGHCACMTPTPTSPQHVAAPWLRAAPLSDARLAVPSHVGHCTTPPTAARRSRLRRPGTSDHTCIASLYRCHHAEPATRLCPVSHFSDISRTRLT